MIKNSKKKGQLLQLIFVLVLIFSISLTLIVSKHVLTEFNNALDESGLHTTESKFVSDTMMNAFVTFDNMVIFILIGVTLGLLITSFFIPSHPAFLVINVIGLFLMVFFAIFLSNVYGEIVSPENEAFYEVIADGSLSKLTFIMQYLPFICCAIVFFSTLAMYAKGRGGPPI